MRGYSPYRTGHTQRESSRSSGERRSPPDRRAWLAMLDYAKAAVERPTDPAPEFGASLKGLSAENFPVGATDIRRRWAKGFVDLARLWVDGGPGTRTTWAAFIADGAKALGDILIEAGAQEAQAARTRMGFKED